jgi:hypothetical protein
MLLDYFQCPLTTLETERSVYDPSSGFENVQDYSRFRIPLLHSTVMTDRLTLKNKLWETLKRVYGEENASAIMPRSFHIQNSPAEWQALWDLCHQIVASGHNSHHIFVMKDERLHQQKGITISTAQSIINKATGIVANKTATNATVVFNKNDPHIAPAEDVGIFAMATLFLANPFIVKDYKINLRR